MIFVTHIIEQENYGSCAKLSPGGPKVMQKSAEEHSKWNTGFNAVVRNTQFSNNLFRDI
jgi:hypothetical protein